MLFFLKYPTHFYYFIRELRKTFFRGMLAALLDFLSQVMLSVGITFSSFSDVSDCCTHLKTWQRKQRKENYHRKKVQPKIHRHLYLQRELQMNQFPKRQFVFYQVLNVTIFIARFISCADKMDKQTESIGFCISGNKPQRQTFDGRFKKAHATS